jgi:hypothetical protein
LEGLSDEPRPGAPRKLSGDAVEAVVVRTLEEPPPRGDTHWSTRPMAEAAGLNQTAISRIWRAFGLKPHLVDSWKLSTDPQFIEKVRDIVGLYLDPRAPCGADDSSGGERPSPPILSQQGGEAEGSPIREVPGGWEQP